MSDFFKESDFIEYLGPKVLADHCNKVLRERGTVVYLSEGSPESSMHWWLPHDIKNVQISLYDKKALLICQEPLVHDSAEKIVWDLAKTEWGSAFAELRDRARKLKGGV